MRKVSRAIAKILLFNTVSVSIYVSVVTQYLFRLPSPSAITDGDKKAFKDNLAYRALRVNKLHVNHTLGIVKSD